MSYDIESLKRKTLVKYPLFGSIVANVDYKEDNDIETAGTDGETIYYNKEFLESLTVEEQVFVFAHEICHIAFDHISKSEGKNPDIWNIATDAVINQYLKRDGLKMIEGAVDIVEAINYDCLELYEKLLKEKNSQQSKSSNGGNNQQGDSKNQTQSKESKSDQKNSNSTNLNSKNNIGHDTHGLWEDALIKHKEEQNKTGNKKGSLLDKILDKDRSLDENQKNQLKNMNEKEGFKKNKEFKKKELENLKNMIASQSLNAGTTTSESVIDIDNIGISKPLLDWRYLLKEAVNYEVDWSYRNANIEEGIITANLEEQYIPETEILLDTSGSIDESLLRNFLRECKNILKTSRLKIGCFDTKFYGFNEIRNEEDIENMKFYGGGGTNFNVAVNAFSRIVENKIIFTDGLANMPDMSLDAIWIVFGSTKIRPKGGRVIYIDQTQVGQLHFYEDIKKIR